jgi:hypothetical protein
MSGWCRHLGANKGYASKRIYFIIKNHTLLSTTKCRVGARLKIQHHVVIRSTMYKKNHQLTTYLRKIGHNILITRESCDMSTVWDRSDKRVKKTLSSLKENPKLKLPEAMLSAEFTIEESRSQRCQQWVRAV